jgi:hypothetical protein
MESENIHYETQLKTYRKQVLQGRVNRRLPGLHKGGVIRVR